MIKVGIIGIITVLAAVFLKGVKAEYGICAGICGSIILVYIAVTKFSGILGIISGFKRYTGSDSDYVLILIKMLGIAFTAEFSSNLCRDVGYSSVAAQIELIGKLSILLISAPIVEALLDTIFAFME